MYFGPQGSTLKTFLEEWLDYFDHGVLNTPIKVERALFSVTQDEVHHDSWLAIKRCRKLPQAKRRAVFQRAITRRNEQVAFEAAAEERARVERANRKLQDAVDQLVVAAKASLLTDSQRRRLLKALND